MGNSYEMQVVAPFSPLILKATAPKSVVDRLNETIDEWVKSPQQRNQRNWAQNLAGHVTSELRVTDLIHEISELRDFLYDVARTYTYRCENVLLNYSQYNQTEELRDKRLEIQIKEGWVNDMLAGDFNPVHYHQGCIYSCVLFLRLPTGFDEELQGGKARQNHAGCLQFIDSRTAVGTKNLFTVKPVVGEFFLWPSWMLHCVYPFRSPGVRRSMSVNLSVL